MKLECIHMALERTVKGPMRKKLLLQMCSLSYSATVFKVEAFLRKLEQSEVVEGGVFVDGNRKKKEKIIFK